MGKSECMDPELVDASNSKDASSGSLNVMDPELPAQRMGASKRSTSMMMEPDEEFPLI